MAATRDRFADRKPGWDTPLMIASHQNGVRTKAMNPNTPVTYEGAIRCWDAGASTSTTRISTYAGRKPPTITCRRGARSWKGAASHDLVSDNVQ